jgi:hypothetical protein
VQDAGCIFPGLQCGRYAPYKNSLARESCATWPNSLHLKHSSPVPPTFPLNPFTSTSCGGSGEGLPSRLSLLIPYPVTLDTEKPDTGTYTLHSGLPKQVTTCSGPQLQKAPADIPSWNAFQTKPESVQLQATLEERKKSLTRGHVEEIGSAEGIQSYMASNFNALSLSRGRRDMRSKGP